MNVVIRQRRGYKQRRRFSDADAAEALRLSNRRDAIDREIAELRSRLGINAVAFHSLVYRTRHPKLLTAMRRASRERRAQRMQRELEQSV